MHSNKSSALTSNLEISRDRTGDEVYTNKLKKETLAELQCLEDLYYNVYTDLSEAEKCRKALSNQAKKIVKAELDNCENLLKYMEYLILYQGIDFFLLVHYLICLTKNILSKDFEDRYKRYLFGHIGNVYNIIRDADLDKIEKL